MGGVLPGTAMATCDSLQFTSNSYVATWSHVSLYQDGQQTHVAVCACMVSQPEPRSQQAGHVGVCTKLCVIMLEWSNSNAVTKY